MKLTSRKPTQIDMQMTSMIDCVFMLLIFFVVTSSYALAERELDPSIKIQRSAGQARDLAPAVVEVRRGASGFVYALGGREFAAQGELIAILRQFENKRDPAIVRASDQAPFEMAATAIQACKSSGFTQVSYEPLAAAN
jgi:biopolymer transport protein ExbD